MTVSAALAELLREAATEGARRALEQLSPSITRWIPLRESPLGYRPTLDLIRAGELTVHGVGNRKFLDREQIGSWLEQHPIVRRESGEDDEIDTIIAATHERRGRKQRGAK
jgi:hypothetical protein